MIIINIKPLKIELVDFNFKENTVEFNVYFNDGLERRISFKKPLINPEELSEKIISEIRMYSKKTNMNLIDDWDEIMVVKVENEENVINKMQRFFEKVMERMKDVKLLKTADGYLDKITTAKKLVMEL